MLYQSRSMNQKMWLLNQSGCFINPSCFDSWVSWLFCLGFLDLQVLYDVAIRVLSMVAGFTLSKP
jgi:hypothetical protein